MVEGNTTRIRIEADGSMAIDGIGKVDLAMDRMGQRTNSVFGQLKQNWVAYTAGIYAAAASLQKAWDFAEKAAAYAESLETLNTLSSQYNVTSQQLVGTISRNSEGLIGVASAAKIASDALAKGFTPAQLEQMAKWAPMIDDFSSSVGSSEEAFEALVASVGAGRERGLVQLLGTTIDLKTAFGDQAASMSKAEKAMAIYNLAAKRMKELQRAGVGATDSLADKMERLKKQVEELNLSIGDIIIRVGAGIMGLFQTVADSATRIARLIMVPATAVAMMTDFLGITKGKAAEYKQAMEAMLASAEDLGKKSAANFDLMKKGMQAGSALAKGAAVNLGMGAGGETAIGEKSKLEDAYLRLHAANLAKEGAIDHDALMSEMGLTQEYHDTLRKMDDEDWAREKKLAADIEELDRKRYAEEGAIAVQALADEMGMTEEYYRVKRELDDKDFEQFKARKTMELQIQEAALKAGGQNAFGIPGMSDLYGSMGQFVNAYSNMKLGIGPWEDWAKAVEAKHEQVRKSYEAGLASFAELDESEKEATRAREQADWMMRVDMAGSAMGMMANMATAFYAMGGKQGGAAFEMMKTFRIGETIMNTYSAAVGAYNAMASIPYVGPALGVAAAAAAIAFGMAQVRAIASMKPGNQGAPSMSVGGSSPMSSVAPAPAPIPAEKKTGPSIINFYINGDVVDHDQFARTLLPYLNKAEAAGVA